MTEYILNTMDDTEIQINTLWDSPCELTIYNILCNILDTEYYDIFPHVVLRDIFLNLYPEMKHQHIDFLITTRTGQPIMGIEINGIEHQNEDYKREVDYKKKLLFCSHDLPLIFIPVSELENCSDPDLLKEMLILFLRPVCFRNFLPSYCPQCDTKLSYLYNRKTYQGYYACAKCKKVTDDEKPLTISCSNIPLPFAF